MKPNEILTKILGAGTLIVATVGVIVWLASVGSTTFANAAAISELQGALDSIPLMRWQLNFVTRYICKVDNWPECPVIENLGEE